MVKISVVLTTYNRGNLLKRALRALVNQTLPKRYYEIIVVDDGSTDNTEQIVKEFSQHYKNIRYFRQAHKGLSAGRNLGISKAKGKIVAFTDDDCIVDKNWLKIILEAFEKDKNIVGVEGKVVSDPKRPLLSSAPENLHGNKFVGCNSAYKKTTLKQLGGYDKRFFAIRDDSDIAFRAMEKGRIVFLPDAIVRHPPLKVGLSHYLRRLKLVQSDVLLYKKHPEKCAKYLGNLFLKNLAQSFVAWAVLLGTLYSLFVGNFFLAVLLIGFLVLFRFLVSIKGKKYSLKEAFGFISVIFLRDLLYVFALAYYWAKTRP